jgi:hypothetical protein
VRTAIFVLLGTIFLFCNQAFADSNSEALQTTAHQTYMDLLESGATFSAAEARPVGGNSSITFGAEKEGSSFLITRVMTPTGRAFKSYVLNSTNEQFLRNFLKDFSSGRARERTVVNAEGVDMALSQSELSEFRNVDYDSMDYDQLKQKFERFLEVTKDKPFSYLTKTYRRKVFNGQISGQSRKMYIDYDSGNWTTNFGQAEKYIESAHSTSKGWELNFRPQATYGEFERMISWFKHELKNAGKLFHSPGHQRIVFPAPDHLSGEARTQWNQGVNEVLRNVQAYIVARGILGQTGIETANNKFPLQDGSFDITDSTTRGILRIDQPGRFGEGTLGVELRAGTKDAYVQQFMEQVITSRIANADFNGLAPRESWALIPDHSYEADQLVERFGVSHSTAEKFLDIVQNNGKISYQIALWQWENAPYMKAKRGVLRWATRQYINYVARLQNPTRKSINYGLRRWLKTCQVDSAIREYLRPKRLVQEAEGLHLFRSTGRVNVNNIDLGIEYSSRFQTKLTAEFSTERLADGSRAWLHTVSDMTPYERKRALRKIAETLGRELNRGRRVRPVDVSQTGAHGHGLSVAYEIRDSRGRKWRVEWDGVGRTYTENGQIVPESLRGGHIEIVTPKFTPKYSEMQALFRTLDKNNIIPSHLSGGGHINVDLAPFEGNPKALARFLSLFHEHRGIISFMFTNANRMAVAEPAEVSAELARKLRNFTGSETELKQLLYNEGYFNQRLGRKTRNMQVDMSAYFQDVIPAEHIHTDFDIKNPNEPWRPQFRVNPKIRKMEFRMFDAPIDAFESSMQIKLVRALLNQALNESNALTGSVQEVNHEKYANDYDSAKRDLRRLCEAVGLSYEEYKSFVTRATVQGKRNMSSTGYKTYREKVQIKGWKKVRRSVWGSALSQARAANQGINSEDVQWRGEELQEARVFRQMRQRAARRAEQLRNNNGNNGDVRREIRMGVNCRSVFQ